MAQTYLDWKIKDIDMKKFTNVADIGDLNLAVAEALEVKKNRFAYTELGRNKT